MKTKTAIIGFLLAFSIIFSGCALDEGAINTGSDLTVTARGASEGINLYFDNIPQDAVYLIIVLWDNTIDNQLSIRALVQGHELDQIKNTKFLTCPFAESGHKYQINVVSLTGKENEDIKIINADAVANGGIYLTNNPLLFLDNENNSVTLSARPAFSDEGVYSQKYSLGYAVSIQIEEGRWTGFGHSSTELTFDYSQMMNEIKRKDKLIGNLPVFTQISFNVEYERIMWSIDIAKTDEYIVSF